MKTPKRRATISLTQAQLQMLDHICTAWARGGFTYPRSAAIAVLIEAEYGKLIDEAKDNGTA